METITVLRRALADSVLSEREMESAIAKRIAAVAAENPPPPPSAASITAAAAAAAGACTVASIVEVQLWVPTPTTTEMFAQLSCRTDSGGGPQWRQIDATERLKRAQLDARVAFSKCVSWCDADLPGESTAALTICSGTEASVVGAAFLTLSDFAHRAGSTLKLSLWRQRGAKDEQVGFVVLQRRTFGGPPSGRLAWYRIADVAAGAHGLWVAESTDACAAPLKLVARQLVPLFVKRVLAALRRLSLSARDATSGGAAVDEEAHQAALRAQTQLFADYCNDAIWEDQGGETGAKEGSALAKAQGAAAAPVAGSAEPSRFYSAAAHAYTLSALPKDAAQSIPRRAVGVLVCPSICDEARRGGVRRGGALALTSAVANAAASLDGGLLSAAASHEAALDGSRAAFDAIRRCDAALAQLIGLALVALVRAASVVGAHGAPQLKRHWLRGVRECGFVFSIEQLVAPGTAGGVGFQALQDVAVAAEELRRVSVVLVDEPAGDALRVPGALPAAVRIACSEAGQYVVALHIAGAKPRGAGAISIDIVPLLSAALPARPPPGDGAAGGAAGTLARTINTESALQFVQYVQERRALARRAQAGGFAAVAAALCDDALAPIVVNADRFARGGSVPGGLTPSLLLGEGARLLGGGRVVVSGTAATQAAPDATRDVLVTMDLVVALLSAMHVPPAAGRAAMNALRTAGLRAQGPPLQ